MIFDILTTGVGVVRFERIFTLEHLRGRRLTGAALKDFAEACRQNGIEVSLTIMPDDGVASPRVIEAIRRAVSEAGFIQDSEEEADADAYILPKM